MLPRVTLDSTGLNNAKSPVQPVHFRTIPSNKTQAELEQLEKNIENKNVNSNSPVTSNSPVSKPQQTEPSVSSAKPERLRFDTYEPSKPVESAGIYEPSSNDKVDFNKTEQKAEYITSNQSSKYDALKTDYYNSVAEENNSILSKPDKEQKRVNILNNELAQAAKKMNLTSAAESIFS